MMDRRCGIYVPPGQVPVFGAAADSGVVVECPNDAGDKSFFVSLGDGLCARVPVCPEHLAWCERREEVQRVYAEVKAERERAHRVHGATSMEEQPPSDPYGVRRDILGEEVGEVHKEYNEARHEGRPVDLGKLYKELIQVAAMATGWADKVGAVLRRRT